jgi:alpha-galactosidase
MSMNGSRFGLGVAIVCMGVLIGLQGQTRMHREASTMLARTPPMGWNSWDAYGTTVGEGEVKANADWMAAHLKQYGWQYIVVDMEWFVTNPVAEGNATNFKSALDGQGRYVPAANRFPSAAKGDGFAPLAAYVHGLGLKFGHSYSAGDPSRGGDKELADCGIASAPRTLQTGPECASGITTTSN